MQYLSCGVLRELRVCIPGVQGTDSQDGGLYLGFYVSVD